MLVERRTVFVATEASTSGAKGSWRSSFVRTPSKPTASASFAAAATACQSSSGSIVSTRMLSRPPRVGAEDGRQGPAFRSGCRDALPHTLRLGAQDRIRDLFGAHDGRDVRVRARHPREDRGVPYAQSADAAHAALTVGDGHRVAVAAHPAGPGGVPDAEGGLAPERPQRPAGR